MTEERAGPELFVRRYGCKRWVKLKSGDELVKPNVFDKRGSENELSYYEALAEWRDSDWQEFQQAYKMDSGDLPGLLKMRPSDFSDANAPLPEKTVDLSLIAGDPFAHLHWETPLPDDVLRVALSEKATQRLKSEGVILPFVEH